MQRSQDYYQNNISVNELKRVAYKVRRMILEITHRAQSGHTGGSLSEVEILVALFFQHMRIDPKNPSWEDRDRFVLSKGHASPGYYTVLALRGFFNTELLGSFEELGSILQMHPDSTKVPGVEISTGSLGQGLSCAAGMALGVRANGRNSYTYVLLGDGECQTGQIWEAAMFTGFRRVAHLIAIVDYNKVQLASKTCEALDLEPFAHKWRSFNWKVLSCDGHDMQEVIQILDRARAEAEAGPVVIIAHTVKGKGVSFMEYKYQWHGRAPNDQELRLAMAELEEAQVGGKE